MNSRERVIRAVEFRRPDRMPIIHAWLQGAFLRHGEALARIFRKYPQDFGDSSYPGPFETRTEDLIEHHREYTDEWGCVWAERYAGIVGIPKRCPLEDWSAFDSYRPPANPAPPEEEIRQGRENTRRAQEKWYVFGHGGTLFERLQQLRGFENLLMDLASGEPRLERLADMVVEYNLASIDRAVKFGVDGIFLADDWGTQLDLLISPKIWRAFFRPRYQRLFDAIHAGG